MDCCNCHGEKIAALAKERDELKKILAQRELELKGANAACGELMGKVEELQAYGKKREAAYISLMHRLDEEKERNRAIPSGNKIPYADRKDVYDKALKRWGSGAQSIKAIEELGEAVVEIARWLNGIGNLDHMAEETADATIMLEQVRSMYGINTKVCEQMDSKIARLQERLSAEADLRAE